jgi:hypothetical protein
VTPADRFEQAIDALLDGRPLSAAPAAADADADPLHVVDAIARAHRVGLFGREAPLEPRAADRWLHLEIRGEIGRGASGTVYRAWDSRLQRHVALKLFASDGREEAALDEGRLLARLNHPHIVRVLGADTADGVAGIWMELLDGDTLDEVVARDGVCGEHDAVLIGLDLARALAAVHAAGLLHRDVKSRNVLRERGGRIVLMDLGAGRAVDAGRHGDATGTPLYMAPEVLAGGAATAASDVYGVGIVLFRLLTGSFPITARTLAELKAAHAAGARQPLAALRPELSPAVIDAIERCCHPDPGSRFASAIEVEAALSAALATAVTRRATVRSPMARRWRRWRRQVVAAGALVAIVGVAGRLTWDSGASRAMRRQMGVPVAPLSTLYVGLDAAVAVIERGTMRSIAPNPTSASPIAVSSDLGVVTMAGRPPWTTGGRFHLDGTPAASLGVVNADFCCFHDGATDGQFNYSPREDSTLLEPAGSRPLAPPGLYRFDRDWSHPQLVFPLRREGRYFGIAYAAPSQTFWLTRKAGSVTALEEWSRDGRLLRTAAEVPATLMGLAVDPRDRTLWAVRAPDTTTSVVRLENFDLAGRHLGSFEVPEPERMFPLGAEFEWVAR